MAISTRYGSAWRPNTKTLWEMIKVLGRGARFRLRRMSGAQNVCCMLMSPLTALNRLIYVPDQIDYVMGLSWLKVALR